MDLGDKLELLAAAARYDASCASSGSSRGSSRNSGPAAHGLGATSLAGVCHSFAGDGRCVSLLKVLYSNSCRKDCAYCANRASVEVQRASFTSEELVSLTMGFYRRNYIEGLFLSSGIFADPDIVMERLIEVARLLREREGFGGYIHLKAIPGCGDRLLRKAGLYADRLSANIELPTASSLARLAPQKSGAEILGAMRFMREAGAESAEDARLRARSRARYGGGPGPAARFAPAGQSTQIVVGASEEDDRTIMTLAGSLYSRLGMRRVYYSAFVPVSPDPRLPSLSGPPLLREHRLYQADWLLRFYGFRAEEILGAGQDNLDDDVDPKTAWALRHPELFPLELETADYAELLRVPGVGVTGAGRIVGTRRTGALRPEDLPKLGIAMKRAAWFLCLKGRPLYSLVDRAPPAGPDPSRLRELLADAPRAENGIGRRRTSRAPGPQMEFEFA